MKSLKCDSCGAGLQIQHNKDSITCEYCGTSMIIERPQPAAANTPVPSETPSPISGAETEAKNAELIEKHKAGRYEIAEIHTKAEQYTKALAIFKQLGEINYKDAQHRVSEIEPLALAMRKKRRKRFLIFVAIFVLGFAIYRIANPFIQRAIIEAGAEAREAGRERVALHSGIIMANRFGASTHVVGLLPDGAVATAGRNFDRQLNVEHWENIVAITTGNNRTVGLLADGTVVSTRGRLPEYEWYDIVMLSSGENHVVGLRADGTVIAYGQNDNGQLDVYSWQGIIAISAGQNHTVGLRADGTVVAAGKSESAMRHLAQWQDIIAIEAGRPGSTLALRADGMVVEMGASRQMTSREWRNIVMLSSAGFITVGLRADGTVVTRGLVENYRALDVRSWQNIVYVTAGRNIIIGLRADGTIVSAGVGERGQLDIGGWRLYAPSSTEANFQ